MNDENYNFTTHIMKVLFLFESPLPSSYHSRTLSPGELRVVAAQESVSQVIALGPKGTAFYDKKVKTETKSELERKITLIRFKSKFPYYLRFIPQFFKALSIIKKDKPALIHAESPHISGITALVLKKLFRIPIAVEYRASYDEIFKYRFTFIPKKIKSLLFWQLCDLVFANSDLILANSNTYAQDLSKRYPKSNVHYYNPGVRLPDNLPKDRKQKVIGFLGRLYPDKGAIFLLKAVVLIKDKLLKERWKVEIAGDGPEKCSLEQFITAHGLQQIVTLTGTQDRWEFLSRINVLVNSNIIKNALEMVNVEAAACSLPTICFGNDLYPETVIHNQTGLKVPNKDNQKLALAILGLLKDRQLLRRMGEKAYQLYEAKYTFKVQAENLGKAYTFLGIN